MSLTSELTDRYSPIRAHIEFVASLVSRASRGSPLGDQCKTLLGLDRLKKEPALPPPPDAGPGIAGVIGTAFDYRVRYHLRRDGSDGFVARYVYRFVSSRRGEKQLDAFFRNLDQLTLTILKGGQSLADPDEELLARYCVVLAHLEAVYRSHGQARLPLPLPRKSRDVRWREEPLLALAEEEAVRDVMRLSRSAERQLAPLVKPAISGELPYYPNPVFAGSSRIGGADADFVLGDALFEVKTARSLAPDRVRAALLQATGYALLDYDDRFSIRRVALYFARHEWVKMWPLWLLLFPLATVVKWTQAGHEPPEDEVRTRLEYLRRLMKIVVERGEIDYDAAFC